MCNRYHSCVGDYSSMSREFARARRPTSDRPSQWVTGGSMQGGLVHPLGTGGSPTRGARSGAGVDDVLRRLKALREELLGGVGGLGDQEVELLALGRGEVLEHEVGGVLAAGRAADADAHPEVVLRAGGAGDRPQAVVAALAAAALEPHAGE